MRVYDSYRDLEASARGSAVAVGNFDGLHLGHRAVMSAAWERANALAMPLGVVTFEPHPRRYFRPDHEPFRLTSRDTKRRLLAEAGVEHLYELPFDAALATLSAEAFIDQVLVEGIGARHVAVGADFVFGKGRGGHVGLLRGRLGANGIAVTAVAPVAAADGAAYSSTRIRTLLREGKPNEAAALLGRPWCVEGLVGPGDKRGRTIGFPTANLELGDLVRPAFGVYAVRATMPGDGAAAPRAGVANLGMRPTIGDGRILLETHLFDFAGDLYGRRLIVDLHAFLRPERKFPGLDALKAQIREDSETARRMLLRG